MEFTVVVLAGGQGRRLGQDKLLVQVGGESLLSRVVGRVATLGREILVVIDRERPLPPISFPYRLVKDIIPGRGSLGGLYAGVREARTPFSLVVAGDMPFLSLALLQHLLELAPGFDAVVPRPGGLLEPLHAVYARSSLPAMEKLLQAGGQRIFDFYSSLRIRYLEEAEIAALDPELMSFFNINTPRDLEMAECLLRDSEAYK